MPRIKYRTCHTYERTITTLRQNDAYMRLLTRLSLLQIMACCRVDANPLSEPMLEYFYWTIRSKFQ